MTGAKRLVIATAVATLVVTALVVALPGLHPAYRNLELHIALQTAEALIGLLAAYLFLGRFRRRERLDDLALAIAFTVLALSNLLFAAVPTVVGADASKFSTWSAVAGRLLGASALTVAAFAGPVRLRISSRRKVGIGMGVVAVVGTIALLAAILEPGLPRGVEVTPEALSRPRLESHWALIGAQAILLATYALAAAGFARRAERTGDVLLGWLALAAVLGTAAHFNYLLYPSLFTEWVYTGDAFRLLFYIVVLVGALEEIGSYWRSVAAVSALEERRRIARDLHDGLAQELAGIRRNLSYLDQEGRFARRARAGVDRAISESRRAIDALSDPWQEPVETLLAGAAREVAEREGTRVALKLANGVELTPAEREAIVMITSEAITNAARHGGAEVVHVELRNGHQVQLRVSDFGCGFDPAGGRADGRGFGLQSMRQRAEAVGARFAVRSGPDVGGTEVKVEL
jgi:signal transduction histidine kinase